jgi:hypothetical protein
MPPETETQLRPDPTHRALMFLLDHAIIQNSETRIAAQAHGAALDEQFKTAPKKTKADKAAAEEEKTTT